MSIGSIYFLFRYHHVNFYIEIKGSLKKAEEGAVFVVDYLKLINMVFLSDVKERNINFSDIDIKDNFFLALCLYLNLYSYGNLYDPFLIDSSLVY